MLNYLEYSKLMNNYI